MATQDDGDVPGAHFGINRDRTFWLKRFVPAFGLSVEPICYSPGLNDRQPTDQIEQRFKIANGYAPLDRFAFGTKGCAYRSANSVLDCAKQFRVGHLDNHSNWRL